MTTLAFLALTIALFAALGRDRSSGRLTQTALRTLLVDARRGARLLLALHEQHPRRTAGGPVR